VSEACEDCGGILEGAGAYHLDECSRSEISILREKVRAQDMFLAVYRNERDEAEAQVKQLSEALDFYADPENYHAILPEHPCGDFANDVGENYDHPMPGKLAREALRALDGQEIIDVTVDTTDWDAAKQERSTRVTKKEFPAVVPSMTTGKEDD